MIARKNFLTQRPLPQPEQPIDGFSTIFGPLQTELPMNLTRRTSIVISGFTLIIYMILISTALAEGNEKEKDNMTTKPTVTTPGLALNDTHSIGEAKYIENLTIFPIYSSVQEDLGTFMTLQDALKQGKAEVREMGGEGNINQINNLNNIDLNQELLNPAPNVLEEEPQQAIIENPETNKVVQEQVQQVQQVQETEIIQQIQQQDVQQQVQMGGGPTVNTLVIENRADIPIIVLAGTVVKGGNQDRQIGQDFVVPPKETVPVDAFCIEHGRWNNIRDGKNTNAQFETMDILANKKVRKAGQYEANQSQVWENVSKVNTDNAQKSDTDSLMATLDNKEIKKQQETLSAQIDNFLKKAPQPQHIVGMAYAVDGKMYAIRWFFNHEVFSMFSKTLINTMALEAITAKSATPKPGKIATLTAKDVKTYITEFDKEQVKETRKTKSLNYNEYYENPKANKSKCLIKKGKSKKAITVDFSFK